MFEPGRSRHSIFESRSRIGAREVDGSSINALIYYFRKETLAITYNRIVLLYCQS